MEIPVRATRSLAGKVAVVTGAGSLAEGIGNGRASAILLAEEGATIICVDMKPEPVEHTVAMITKEGKGEAIAITADVTKDKDCKRIVETALQKFGRLDILINNVGVSGPKGTAVEVDMVEWAKGMEINVSTMVLMAKFAIPAMVKNEVDKAGGYIRGSIVNLGSVSGLRGGTPSIMYPTSKGAIVNMTRAMAAHHAKDGIRVNCVCPGMVYTPMMYGKEGGMSEEVRENRKQRSLLGTEGNGWDVGHACRFLASAEARWITGAIIPVDAGATAAVGAGQQLGH